MDKLTRKEMVNQYKCKQEVGGVYCIECSGNQHRLIRSTPDIESAKSRYDFSIKIESCPEPTMLNDWKEYGMASFSFTCLEELSKKEDQSRREFHDDLKTLCDLWKEKYQSV